MRDPVEQNQLAPAIVEDEHADLVVRRGRNAGGRWIVASVAVYGWCMVTTSLTEGAIAFGVGTALFTIGMVVRSRFWRRARRELGDAAVQRARWRSAAAERDAPERLIAACAVVVLLVAAQLWRR